MNNSKSNILCRIGVGIHLGTKVRISLLVCTGLLLLIFCPSVTAWEFFGNEPNLMELAEREFPTMSPLEKNLFRKVADGEFADYTADTECKLRANYIAWLCTDLKASKLVMHNGIWIKGAHITGKLDLSFAKISFPLRFEGCKFTKDINLEQATVHVLDFSGTHTLSINAKRLTVEGDVRFRNDFKAKGTVNLIGAKIGGYLDCSGGKFINKRRRGYKNAQIALEATGIKVEGNVNLCGGFDSKGTVSLYGATIGRELDCKGGKFTNPGLVAFNGDQMQVDGCVFLSEGFKAEGQVRLIGAIIGRDLDCTNGKFFITSNKTANSKGFGEALKASGMKVSGNMYLRKGFEATGMVRLVDATVDGFLDCSGGKFSNNSDGLNGPVEAIEATRLQVGGTVSMCIDKDTKEIFRATGMVSLYGANIGGDLDCKRGEFVNPKGTALCADLLEVDQHVFLSENFHAEGEVCFKNAKINGYLLLGNIDSPKKAKLNLQFAQVSMLNIKNTNEDQWPRKLLLQGLNYEEINDDFADNQKALIKWLRLQYGEPGDYFRPQPYEKLAEVLSKSGRKTIAKKILITKNDDKKDPNLRLPLTRRERLWHSMFGALISYGYKPWHAAIYGMGFVLLGWLIFSKGFKKGFIKPTKEKEFIKRPKETEVHNKNGKPNDDFKPKAGENYPKFNALMYSLDIFVPLIDLHQSKYWLPNINKMKTQRTSHNFILFNAGGLLWCYLWIQTIFGWLLTLLLVAGLTGLVRK
jgi:hypothetical protein